SGVGAAPAEADGDESCVSEMGCETAADAAGWGRAITTMSTRRFCALPSTVSFGATGWCSEYPAAASRSGSIFFVSSITPTQVIALAMESSQFDGNLTVWIGVESVWPSIRIR